MGESHTDPIHSDGACVASVPLALLDAGLNDPEVTLAHLADDLEEALDAYERFATRSAWGTPGGTRRFRVERVPLGASGPKAPIEQILGPTAPLAPSLTAPRRLIYAIAASDDASCAPAVSALEALERSCAPHDIAWGGGVAIGGGRLILPFAHHPRMGFMRRARSERLDELIAAIRSGCSVSALPDGAPTGVIAARCPVPAPLYPLISQLAERIV